MKFSIVLALWVSIALANPQPLRAADQGPVEMNAILPLTGPAALLGTKEAETLAVLEADVNKRGGIRGRPLKIVIQDDGSNPQVTVQLANGLIAKNVTAIVGSSVSAICRAVEPIVEKGGPVTYCLSPIVHPPNGSYMFSANVGNEAAVPVAVAYLKSRGWTKIALLMATDASGKDYEESFTAAVETPAGAGLGIVAVQHYNPQDVSVAAQIASIKALAPQVLVTFSTGTAFTSIVRGANDAGLNVPIFASATNLSPVQLDSYRAFGKELFFVAGAGAVVDPAPSPRRAAQLEFFGAFADQHRRPEYLQTLAWDPAMFIVNAWRKLGPDAPAAQIRDYIAQTRGVGGVSGVYDFRAIPQRGLGSNAVAIYHWDPATNEITTRPLPR